MREVAAEAGVSLRQVQYYFGTKEELLLAAMQHLAGQFGRRAQARISRLAAALMNGPLPAHPNGRPIAAFVVPQM